MKSKLSRHEAEAELVAIRQLLEGTLKQIRPLHGQAMTGTRRESLYETLTQVVAFHGRAVALRSQIKTSRLDLDLASQTAGLQLFIEWAGGKILPLLNLRGGDHKSATRGPVRGIKGLGLSRTRSAGWQAEGRMPKACLDRYFVDMARKRQLPSSHGLRCLAHTHLEITKSYGDGPNAFCATVRGMRRLADEKRQFGFIYLSLVGPRESGGRADGIPIDARLAHLPLAEVAAPHACLCLKVAPEWSREALNGLNASGFRLRSCLLIPGPSLNPTRGIAFGAGPVVLGDPQRIGRLQRSVARMDGQCRRAGRWQRRGGLPSDGRASSATTPGCFRLEAFLRKVDDRAASVAGKIKVGW